MVCLAESMDIGQNSVVMEVEEGVVKRNIHNCLFSERVPSYRLFAGANVGVREEVDHIAQLAMPHGPIEGRLPQTWGYPCPQVSHWGLPFKGHTCLDFPVNVSGRVPGVSRVFRVIGWWWWYIERWFRT